MREIRLIASREITERLEGRLLRVMTIITALIVVAAIVIPAAVSGGSSPTKVGLVGVRAQSLAPALRRTAATAKVKLALSNVPAGAAVAELKSGGLDVALALTGTVAFAQVKETLPAAVKGVIALTLAGAGQRIIGTPVITRALSPPPKDRSARAVAALVAAIVMYVSLVMYGGAVATGVAQEKTSRTAEVLLGSVSPRQLLSGKIIGIGSTGLGQLSVAALAGLVANAAVHSTKIPSSVWVLLPALLVCFLLGFTLYSFAFAAAGALVARQEEVQFATMPFTMMLLVGYLIVYAAIASPNAAWLRVISFFPPLTASVMPARIALGHVAAWEIPVATVLMLLAIWATATVAARVYAGALTRGGARLGWRDALAR